MQNRTEEALEQFSKGYNCAQSILSTYGKQFGLDETTAYQVTTGFGAGMGRLLETCGLLTGAFMVIGMKHSMITPENVAEKERAYALIRQLAVVFREKHGATACSGITGYSQLNTEEENQQFAQDPIRAETCRTCMKTVTSFLEENLSNEHE
ncbi:MAG: C_GCAxxG_C_C family protein [Bacteroidia bacterium]|nr:C_GCAxxG_C_C family protein [Bacteroidia bacterium]